MFYAYTVIIEQSAVRGTTDSMPGREVDGGCERAFDYHCQLHNVRILIRFDGARLGDARHRYPGEQYALNPASIVNYTSSFYHHPAETFSS